MLNLKIPSPVTKLRSTLLEKKKIELFVKRDDLIHNVISGNKWRKLKYNFLEAKLRGYNKILSYGGYYSNHLHALSYACNMFGFQSIGVIRGEKVIPLNKTLSFCMLNKMEFIYMDRELYNRCKKNDTIAYDHKIGKCFIVPEGGANKFGIKGCEEIIKETSIDFNYICCPVGTGCTASGIIQAMQGNQFFLGFCAFNKIHEQQKAIINFLNFNDYKKWQLFPDKYFGGFAKVNDLLLDFIENFKLEHNIELDLIYTGKMFYSLFKLIEQDFFQKNSKLLVIHTGGLQGLP